MKSQRLEPFEGLVEAFENLPGVGHKTAMRLAYHIVMDDAFNGMKLAHAIEHAVSSLRTCIRCHNLSENELCDICSDSQRDKSKLTVVQSAKDIFIIEELGEYDGLYYVLRDVEDLDPLHLREAVAGVSEIIFAFPPGLASDTMMLYIESQLEELPITFSKIAQGVPTGVALENIDTLSLVRALEDRIRI